MVSSSGNDLSLKQSYNFATGIKLSLRGRDSATVGSSEKVMCGQVTSVSMSTSCENPSWTFLENWSLQHSTDLYLNPTGSSFGREDENDLVLSGDCAGESKWEFWEEPLRPPGFKSGFKIAGEASSFSISGSTNRFSVSVENEDGASEEFRERLSGPDGTLSNLIVGEAERGVKRRPYTTTAQ